MTEAGQLGRGYQGIKKILMKPFDEGRIWATSYTPDQMKGIMGVFRRFRIGYKNPFAGNLKHIRISGEAAAAFSKPVGTRFSWNLFGWTKGLTPQYQFRGILSYSGKGVISSLSGSQGFTRNQMAAYRFGELWRMGLYGGGAAAAGYGAYKIAE